MNVLGWHSDSGLTQRTAVGASCQKCTLRGVTVNDKGFEDRFSVLLEQINDLPEPDRQRLLMLADDTRRRHEQMHDNFARIRSRVDDLLLHNRYVTFDLEATRRERDQFRAALGRGGSSDHENDDQPGC